MVATIEVFTSPTCPHCPSAVKLAKELAKEMDDVKVIESSTATSQGQKRAQKYSIMTVPTVLVSGPSHPQKIGLQGTPPKSSLIKAVEVSLGLRQWEKEKQKSFFSKLLKKLNVNIKL